MKIILFLVILQSILPQGHLQTCGKVTDLEATLEPLRRIYSSFLVNTTNSYALQAPKPTFDQTALELQQECSWTATHPHKQGKILGGDLVNFTVFPYYAQIESETFCSGIILNRFWILGSDHPHCLSNIKAIRYGENVKLRASMEKLVSLPSSFNISKCGIAVIKVFENMRDNRAFPICLPWDPDDSNYTSCYAVSVGIRQSVPRFFRVIHVPQPVCEYFFKCRNITLGKNILCFRFVQDADRFDDGDSGTPIVCNMYWERMPVVVGIYRAMNYDNAFRIFYSVSIKFYLNWIIDALAMGRGEVHKEDQKGVQQVAHKEDQKGVQQVVHKEDQKGVQQVVQKEDQKGVQQVVHKVVQKVV